MKTRKEKNEVIYMISIHMSYMSYAIVGSFFTDCARRVKSGLTKPACLDRKGTVILRKSLRCKIGPSSNTKFE